MHLTMFYSYMYSDFDALSVVYNTSGRAHYNGEVVHSTMARTDNGSAVSAYWPTKNLRAKGMLISELCNTLLSIP